MPTLESIQKEVPGFLGVNLRNERIELADYALAKAINADLHTILGTIMCRHGRTKLYSSSLGSIPRRLSRVNNIRYQVGGTILYRAQTNIKTGLSSNQITTIGAYRPFADATLWAFIADDAVMIKDNGTNTRTWGLTAPTATPAVAAGAAGSLTGDYKVQFTYVRKSGTTVAAESNPSPASLVVTLASKVLSITGLTASTDAQVTHIRIYRTAAGGASYLYDQEITNGTTTATSSQADSALGAQVATDHNPPPLASWTVVHQDHTWLCRDAANPDYLWYSNRFYPEYFPTTQYLEIGNADDPLQCAVPWGGMLGVFSRRTKYRVIGNAVSGFVAQEAVSRRGTPSPNGVISTEMGTIFPARDGIFMTTFSGGDSSLSDAILPLFMGETINDMMPVNWNYPNAICAATYKNRYYFSYPSGNSTLSNSIAVYSFDTKKWYFYDHPMQSLFYEEDTDQLLGGSQDQFVYILENGTSDAGSSIAMTIETKNFLGGQAENRKIFHFFRVDADCLGDTITAQFYVDGTLKGTYPITGTRTKVLNVLPEGCMGFQAKVKFTYTGTQRIRIYGFNILAMSMALS